MKFKRVTSHPEARRAFEANECEICVQAGKSVPQQCEIYFKNPDAIRTVLLSHWEPKHDPDILRYLAPVPEKVILEYLVRIGNEEATPTKPVPMTHIRGWRKRA